MGYPRFPLRIPSKLGEPDAYGTKCPIKLVQQSRLLKSISDHVGEISRIHCHLRQSRLPAEPNVGDVLLKNIIQAEPNEVMEVVIDQRLKQADNEEGAGDAQ